MTRKAMLKQDKSVDKVKEKLLVDGVFAALDEAMAKGMTVEQVRGIMDGKSIRTLTDSDTFIGALS